MKSGALGHSRDSMMKKLSLRVTLLFHWCEATHVATGRISQTGGGLTRYLLLAATAAVGFTIPIQASPIIYTFTASGGSGVLNGIPFTNATVVATLTGDSSNIAVGAEPSAGGFYTIPVNATVYVEG